MESQKITITVETTVDVPVAKAWECWTEPQHIIHWNFASDDWHAPHAENDLRVGGNFLSRMEAKDGSFGFDFTGTYDVVVPNKSIGYTMGDGRIAKINFTNQGDSTLIVETFEAETENSVELQKGGWQAILNNFKKYAEQNQNIIKS